MRNIVETFFTHHVVLFRIHKTHVIYLCSRFIHLKECVSIKKYFYYSINVFSLISVSLILSGCFTSTRVQGDYISQRDDCRSVAEQNVGGYTPQQSQSAALAVKDKNAVLAKIFSECMFNSGWTVASPGQKPSPPRVIAGGKPELDALSQGSRASAARTAKPQEQNTYVTPSTPFPANRQPVNVPRGGQVK